MSRNEVSKMRLFECVRQAAPADREAFVWFHLASKSSALPQLHLLYADGKHTSHVQGGGWEGVGGEALSGLGIESLDELIARLQTASQAVLL